MNGALLQRHKLHNWLHSALLLGGMGLILALLGWLLAGVQGTIWVAVAGLAVLVFAPRVSPRLVLAMYGGQELSPHHAPQLHDVVRELSRRAGLTRQPALYYIPSPVLNAFTVGNRDDAAIALTDGLLRAMSWRELTGVLAHELSHVRHNDIWVMGLADLVSRMTHLLSLFGQLLLIINLPLFLLTDASISWLAILLLIFAPTLSALLQLALSRTREFEADRSAAELSGDPRGLASALDRLERQQGGLWDLFYMPGRRNPDPSMLRSHPRTAERIQRLLALSAEPRSTRGPIELGSEWDPFLRPSAFPRVTRRPRQRLLGGFWH